MAAFLLVWWPVFVLVHVPRLANKFAVWLARVTAARFQVFDGELAQTAGAWLRARTEALGVRTIVTDDHAEFSRDAFHVDHHVIQLTVAMHEHAGPVGYAVAAHELGHAHIQVRFPALVALYRWATGFQRLLVLVAVGMTAGNALFALPGVTALAFDLFVLALALAAIDVLDEAAASVWAARELRRSAQLTGRHLTAVRWVLATSFFTYLSIWLAHAFLLTQWQVVETIIGDGRLGGSGGLTTLGWIVAAVITACGGVFAWTRVHFAFGEHVRLPREALAGELLLHLVWQTLLAVFIYLVWDLHATSDWAWCVILALSTLSGSIVSVFELPVWLAGRLLRPLLHRFTIRAWELPFATKQAARPLVKEGNSALRAIVEDHGARRSVTVRVFELVRLAYLPLTIALWLLLLG